MTDDAFTGLLRPGGGESVTARQPARAAASVEALGPQRAVRARLNAIILDILLLGLVDRVLLAVAGTGARATTSILLFLALQLAYFFGFEASTGQTLGKRVFHVRVTTLSGAAPSARQVAWRTVLRLVDSLPLLYASGLLSLMRTGPARRQRIGDVAAGTTVILDASGTPLRTPRWVLPVATVLATVVSIPFVLAAIDSRRSARRVPAPTGFADGPGSAPIAGRWQARAQALNAIGYANVVPGERYDRPWLISRRCGGAGCALLLTVALSHESPATAPLSRAGDGWHATFPIRMYPCASTAAGRTIYWPQRSTIVLRFTDGGRRAQAAESDFSAAPGCGYGTDTVAWIAARG
jgi:uncharacterized RDD family membrane protein YckC